MSSFTPPWEKGAAPVAQQAATRGPAPEAPKAPVDEGMAPVMQEATKIRRAKFVAEYVKDWNGTKAAIRYGVDERYAANRATEWLKEPYTQQLLWGYIEEMKEEAIVSRNQVIAGLHREANYFGPGSSPAARVNAWARLAKVLGMEVININAKVQHKGGVMMVPVSGGVDDWEQAAAEAQRELKESVRH